MKLGEEQMGLENLARLRKQDNCFCYFVNSTPRAVKTFLAAGVLEILPDGFGFLRSADSFLPCWS